MVNTRCGREVVPLKRYDLKPKALSKSLLNTLNNDFICSSFRIKNNTLLNISQVQINIFPFFLSFLSRLSSY